MFPSHSSGTALAAPNRVVLASPRTDRRTCPRGPAGFSLIESMVVIVMVGILVALALPTISQKMRDRRLNQAAWQVALVYQQARALAMGRGSAVDVRFDASGAGAFEVREAVQSTNPALAGYCQLESWSGCLTTNWDSGAVSVGGASTAGTGAPKYRVYPSMGFTPSSVGAFGGTTVGSPASPLFSGTVSTLDVCFTPLGRTFYRVGGTSGSWSPLLGAFWFNLTRTDYPVLPRTVLVPPNGMARLGA